MFYLLKVCKSPVNSIHSCVYINLDVLRIIHWQTHKSASTWNYLERSNFVAFSTTSDWIEMRELAEVQVKNISRIFDGLHEYFRDREEGLPWRLTCDRCLNHLQSKTKFGLKRVMTQRRVTEHLLGVPKSPQLDSMFSASWLSRMMRWRRVELLVTMWHHVE